MSSVLHSFFVLEAAINELSFQCFFEHGGNIYFPESSRNYTLRKAITMWQNVSCIDKLQMTLECISPSDVLPEKVLAELREFNTFRNLLVHGFVFKRIVLLEKTDPVANIYTEIDREDPINWSRQFPNLKFSPVDELSPKDARTALLITLRALTIIHMHTNQPLVINSLYHGSCHSSILEENLRCANVEKFLDDHLDRAAERERHS